MSISNLQSTFASRTGRDILPENLPMDVLISLARELAFLDEGRMDHTEIHQFKVFLCDLVERLLGMQSMRRLVQFKEKGDELLPVLLGELNIEIRSEIVTRLIEHRSSRVELDIAFEKYFPETSTST